MTFLQIYDRQVDVLKALWSCGAIADLFNQLRHRRPGLFSPEVADRSILEALQMMRLTALYDAQYAPKQRGPNEDAKRCTFNYAQLLGVAFDANQQVGLGCVFSGTRICIRMMCLHTLACASENESLATKCPGSILVVGHDTACLAELG